MIPADKKQEEVLAGLRITRVPIGTAFKFGTGNLYKVCIHFEGKPSEAVRTELKHRGFSWSPTSKVWLMHSKGDEEQVMAFLTWYEGHQVKSVEQAKPLSKVLAQGMGGGGPIIQRGFIPSPYQQAIFDTLGNPNATENNIVEAVAGSGKTTVLVKGAKFIKGSGLFVAFNKHIQEELQRRLVGTNFVANTIHSLGMAMLREKLGGIKKVNVKKFMPILDEYALQHRFADGDWHAVRKLIDLARIELVSTSQEMEEILNWHGIDYTNMDDIAQAVKTVLALGLKHTFNTKEIDFVDMIALPNLLELTAQGVDFILADECQDFSKAQLGIILKLMRGRAMFVGDPKQAIYFFAGADSQSYYNIKTRVNARELPLSICYRCAPNITALARNLVPQIEANPAKQDGIIASFEPHQLAGMVTNGDLVLSRVTAPLVALCIELIQAKKPATIKGRDIGKEIVTLIETVDKNIAYLGYADFGRALSRYEDETVQVLAQKEGKERQIESLRDKCEAVHACMVGYSGIRSVEGLKQAIESLFTDDGQNIILSTIHKSKGLEAKRVFITSTAKLPLVWKNQNAQQAEQELNLLYVAITRAMEELYVENGQFSNGLTIDSTPMPVVTVEALTPIQPALF